MAADNPIDPIHQFEISKIAEMQIAGIDISFTNSSLFMVFAIAATMTLFISVSYTHLTLPTIYSV